MDSSRNLETNYLLFGKMSSAKVLSCRSVRRTVWWIKRDIRISDNHCLFLATELSNEVIPFFCWEPSVLNACGLWPFSFAGPMAGFAGVISQSTEAGVGIGGTEGRGGGGVGCSF